MDSRNRIQGRLIFLKLDLGGYAAVAALGLQRFGQDLSRCLWCHWQVSLNCQELWKTCFRQIQGGSTARSDYKDLNGSKALLSLHTLGID